MSGYLGDFQEDQSLTVVFPTYGASGESITMSGLAVTDIEIYKGSSMTQRASDAGYALIDTDGIDIDTTTGVHGFTVDLSDNTDAGFYEPGYDYTIVVNSITVNSQTVVTVFKFSIENRAPLRLAGYDNETIFFDGDNGTNPATAVFGVHGKTWRKMSDEADVKTLLTASGYRRVSVVGDYDCESDYAEYVFEAANPGATINLGGSAARALGSSVFAGFGGVSATNAPTGTGQVFVDCTLANAMTLPGPFRVSGGTVSTTLTLGTTTGTRTFENVHFDGGTIAFGTGTSDVVNLINCTGSLTVTSTSGGTVNKHGGSVQITNSLTSGTLNNDGVNVTEWDGNAVSWDSGNAAPNVNIASMSNLAPPANWGPGVAAALMAEAPGDYTDPSTFGELFNDLKTIVDKLDAAQAEPTGVPAANETPLVKIARLYMEMRNEVRQTATKRTVYDDGGVGEYEYDVSDDGTTATKSEANAI